MELKNFFAQDLQGNVIPSPTVYLYEPGTTTLAAGMLDASGNVLTNPFTGTANGQVTVAAPDGNYDMRVVGSGRDTTMRVRFIDSIAGSADILRGDLASTASAHGAEMVGYLPAGVGATPTSVHARLRETDANVATIFGNIAEIATNPAQAVSSFTDLAYIVSRPDTSNKADPAVVDPGLPATTDQLHRLYNLGTGALSAQSPSTLGSFAVTKKYDVTAGSEYTVSMHNAPLEFSFYFVAVSPWLQFFNTDGSFHSQVATGFTRGPGDRSVTVTVPAGAERVAFNLRNAADFSNTYPMTEAALQSCLDKIMLNIGASAADFAPYSDGTFAPTSALFDADPDNQITVIKQNNFYYVRSACQQSTTKDVVWRLLVNESANYDRVNSRSGVVDFYGIRFIDKVTDAANTIAAFNQSVEVHSSGIDESCPIKLNSMYVAGGHGVVGYNATMAAHGKTAVDVGSIWSDGVDQWVLYYVESASLLTFVRRYTGATDKWRISSADFGGTTLTHVSGATHTGNVVMTASAQRLFVPIVRGYLGEMRVDDVAITADGLYRGNRVVLAEIYSLLNAALQQDYLIAQVGAATPDYTNAAIADQVRFFYEYEWNRYGAMSVRTAQGVKDAYSRSAGVDYWGGIQLQRLSLVGDSTPGMHSSVWLYVPDVAMVDGYDLKNVADITSNAAEVRIPRAACDNPADPASHFCMIGKGSGGNVLSGHLYGYSRLEGLGVPATRAANVTDVMFFSSAEKNYPIAIDSAAGDSVDGDIEVVTAFRAPFVPTDATLTVPAVVVDMSGKTFIYISAHQNLGNKDIAVPSSLNGRKISIVKSSPFFSLRSEYIGDGVIRATFSSVYADVVLHII